MNFGYMPSYYNPLDREYDRGNGKETPLREVELGNIGISTMPMGNQMEQLKARIFQGASAVELGFSGRGKGSMGGQNTTPEMYGKDEREDIRQMADFNKIKLSTHASYNIGPLSGMTQQGFDNGARENTLREIERAIDFAADTARGGAVVVHTGEFQRPLSEMDKSKFGNFELHPHEADEAAFYLVDNRTGQIVSGIKKDQEMMLPIYETDPRTKKWLKDDKGMPIAKFNEEKGEFETRPAVWEDIEKITKWYNEENNSNLSEAEVFNRISTQVRANYQLGFAKTYEERYKQTLEQKKNFDLIKNNLDNGIYEQRYDQILQRNTNQDISKMDNLAKIEEMKKIAEAGLTEISGTLKDYRDSAVSAKQAAMEEIRKSERAVPIEVYAKEKTADTLARAAEFAHKKSETLRDRGQLNSPIYVSPENIFPESYGAHPQELKQIIIDARRKYVDTYKKDYGEEGARKLAEDHIKATFDIGHAYTWRKYYKDNPNKSFEENDKDFKSWLMNQVEDLNKKGYIKHIHVSDNFGYEDEHVTPGQGRVPIKEFIDKMKQAGVTEITVEPAHQDYRAMLGAWKEFGAPVYGADQSLQKWTDVQFSYFGKTRSPYFVFGEYSPSQDFTLWSQVPLE